MEREFQIRPERENEYESIYNLIKEAFETAKVSDGDEQDFAENLRRGEGYIPQLALVAEQNEKLIGHVMLTRIYIKRESGNKKALLLAPLSVLLEYRSLGVGASLVEESKKRALDMGYDSIFLVGDPAYYGRFGFTQISKLGVAHNTEIPDQFVLACELLPRALKGVGGVVEVQ